METVRDGFFFGPPRSIRLRLRPVGTERSQAGLSMSHDGSAYSSRRLTSSQRSRPLDSAEHLPVRTKLKPPRSLAPWRSMSILPCASCCAGGILSLVDS